MFLHRIQTLICHYHTTGHYSYRTPPLHWEAGNSAKRSMEVFLVNEVTSDFQGSHWNSGLCPHWMTDLPRNLRRLMSQGFSDYGSFLGLAVGCYVCQLSFTKYKTRWSTFTSQHIFHCNQRAETFLQRVLLFTNCHSFLTLSLWIMVFVQDRMINQFGETAQADKWKAEGTTV